MQEEGEKKVKVRVGVSCPCCREVNVMSAWERTEWHAGNNWKSTCIRCGTIERKQ